MINDDVLLGLKKPARYTGGEWNSSNKDFEAAGITFALGFPDLYEVGMSNLGIRIIYSLLNALPDVVCERFFSPDLDCEALIRERGYPLATLESRRQLKEFDIVGLSLAYELCYTNVLALLDLGGIPFDAAQRDHTFPLIIGGGPCSLNPEPLCSFFDLFVIGEAEEVVLELMDVYRRRKAEYRAGRLSKQDLLSACAQLKGVYVPSLATQQTVQKRFIASMDAAHVPLDWLVPFIQIVHDRITVEVSRGCPNRCRFCQARNQYYPYRNRSLDTVITAAQETYRRTGYDEISLSGLSVSDYPGLKILLERLIDLFREKGVSVSLPSVKSKLMLGELSEVIARIKKTGLTFAPEAGTEQMRQRLAKDFDLEEFFVVLQQAYQAGYQHVKLYFMIGLPGETQADLDGIVELVHKVSDLRRSVCGRAAEVHISVNALIPKPHTAFQWMRMEDPETIRVKQEYLKDKLRARKFKLSFHHRQMSFLEGVFSRGDRALGAVVQAAYKKGCRFDGWQEHFVFERWMEAFSECGLQPQDYLRQRDLQEPLPWDFLDTGVPKELLLSEARKVL
ncbi:MAG TPA: radical SAM protein [Candidatus Omnitrophota bacterium]|nr:radical SAM protein [Candidatus Omnitrophota bacterium]HRZ15273.1 radical SAM protein [Candidatus Omnitrophota bacterium]